MTTRFYLATSLMAAFMPLACAGAPPAPERPQAMPLPAPAVASVAASASAGASAPADKAEPPAETPKPPETNPRSTAFEDGLKPTQKPRDIITGADTIFLLSYENSDPGKAAERKCGASADEDAKRDCLAKAREKVQLDALRFKKDVTRNWWWTTMQKRGDQLLMLHRVMFDFGEETDRSIVLKLKGKDQGMAPWGAMMPRELRIEVPNDFTIVIQDPQLGKLVYEAKIGLATK